MLDSGRRRSDQIRKSLFRVHNACAAAGKEEATAGTPAGDHHPRNVVRPTKTSLYSRDRAKRSITGGCMCVKNTIASTLKARRMSRAESRNSAGNNGDNGEPQSVITLGNKPLREMSRGAGERLARSIRTVSQEQSRLTEAAGDATKAAARSGAGPGRTRKMLAARKRSNRNSDYQLGTNPGKVAIGGGAAPGSVAAPSPPQPSCFDGLRDNIVTNLLMLGCVPDSRPSPRSPSPNLRPSPCVAAST